MDGKRARNWPALLGPPLAVAGAISYFTFFYQWPVTRDFPWLNYAVLVLALALSSLGLQRATGRGALRTGGAALGLLLSLGCSALFLWYTQAYSAQLPGEAQALPLDAPLPGLVLANERGERVDLAQIDGPLVLVFYRGYW